MYTRPLAIAGLDAKIAVPACPVHKGAHELAQHASAPRRSDDGNEPVIPREAGHRPGSNLNVTA